MLFSLLALLIGLMLACIPHDQQASTSPQDPQTSYVVGHLVGGVPVLASDLSDVENLLNLAGYTDVTDYGFSYDPDPEKYDYLTWSAKKEGSDVIGAISIEENNGVIRLRATGPRAHSCAGKRCSKCKFTRNKIDRITGCECDEPGVGNKCNHSVTEWENLPPPQN